MNKNIIIVGFCLFLSSCRNIKFDANRSTELVNKTEIIYSETQNSRLFDIHLLNGIIIQNGNRYYLIDKDGELIKLPIPKIYSYGFDFTDDSKTMVISKIPEGEKATDLFLCIVGESDCNNNITNTPNKSELQPEFWSSRINSIVYKEVPLDSNQEFLVYPGGILKIMEFKSSNIKEIIKFDDYYYFSSFLLSPNGESIARGFDNKIININGPISTINMEEFGNPGISLLYPAWSPDGNGMAWYYKEVDENNNKGIILLDLEKHTSKIIYSYTSRPCGCDIGYSDLAWSPDGTRIAFKTYNEIVGSNTKQAKLGQFTSLGGPEGIVRIISLLDNSIISFPENTGEIIWSPDSKWLVLDCGGNYLERPRVVDIHNGREEEILFYGFQVLDWIDIN
jgi:hypothetical protein